MTGGTWPVDRTVARGHVRDDNAHFVIRLSARGLGYGYLVGYGVIGSTTDSGSVSLGSSPGIPANAANTLSVVSPDSPMYRG